MPIAQTALVALSPCAVPNAPDYCHDSFPLHDCNYPDYSHGLCYRSNNITLAPLYYTEALPDLRVLLPHSSLIASTKHL